MNNSTSILKSLVMFVSTLLINFTLSAQKPEIEWSEIPAGTFMMGSPKNEIGHSSKENQHKVTLKAFKMSTYEITVGQFKTFIDATGYKTDADKNIGGVVGGAKIKGKDLKYAEGINWKCDERGNIRPDSEFNYPVINISWNDAKAFAEWMGGLLPTEAQWEYACRAGTATPYNTGNCLSTTIANFNGTNPSGKCSKGEYRKTLMPVNFSSPNAWGLYNMHGNVAEWCNDWYGPFTTTPQTDPTGPVKGSKKIGRGGSWFGNDIDCRSANRGSRVPEYRNVFLGFRIVM
jgi:formylglycine-generating enzyme required for sulfatase activity